jgi:hypothetical protein
MDENAIQGGKDKVNPSAGGMYFLLYEAWRRIGSSSLSRKEPQIMLKDFFTWNPQGLRRLSFRGFQWFPHSSSKQLEAAVITTVLVVLAAALAEFLSQYVPIPNINILFIIMIAFFLADRVHPHPIVGPIVITLPIVGIIWMLFLLVPDTLPVEPSIVLWFAANLFLSLFTGALLAVVFKAQKSQPQKQ